MSARWLIRSQVMLAGLALTLSIHAATFSVPGVPIRFEAPEGMTPLTVDEIRVKYPRGRPPSIALGDDNRTTSIAVGAPRYNSPAPPLEDLKESIEKTLPQQIPDLKWLRREIIELHGHRWVFFELTSDAIDTSIHNLMLATTVDRQLVFVNFNSTREEFPQWDERLRKSLQSVQVTTEQR